MIDEIHIGKGERNLLVTAKFSHDVMAVNDCASAVNDHTPNLQRDKTSSHGRVEGSITKTGSLSSLRQSKNQAPTKNRLSQLTSCLRKCCCCLCSSTSVTHDRAVTLPLLPESSQDVTETQQPSTEMINIVSNQPTGNKTNESSIRISHRDWSINFPKVSIS